MTMMERLVMVVDMVALKSKLLGVSWQFRDQWIRTVNGSCPLEFAEGSIIGATDLYNLTSSDASTNGRPGGVVFVRAADAESPFSDSPEYQLREHMVRALGVGLALVFLLSSVASAATLVRLSSGGLVPCDHPLAIADGKGCNASVPVVAPPVITPPPAPYQQPPQPFRLGRTYVRTNDGQRIFVAGLGQLEAGFQVWFFECRNTMFVERCSREGEIWTVVGNAVADGWVEVQ
jgi:hypothetical protein